MAKASDHGRFGCVLKFEFLTTPPTHYSSPATTFGAADPQNIEDRLFRWSVNKGFNARIGGDWDDRDHCVFVATDDSDDDLVGLIGACASCK